MQLAQSHAASAVAVLALVAASGEHGLAAVEAAGGGMWAQLPVPPRAFLLAGQSPGGLPSSSGAGAAAADDGGGSGGSGVGDNVDDSDNLGPDDSFDSVHTSEGGQEAAEGAPDDDFAAAAAESAAAEAAAVEAAEEERAEAAERQRFTPLYKRVCGRWLDGDGAEIAVSETAVTVRRPGQPEGKTWPMTMLQQDGEETLWFGGSVLLPSALGGPAAGSPDDCPRWKVDRTGEVREWRRADSSEDDRSEEGVGGGGHSPPSGTADGDTAAAHLLASTSVVPLAEGAWGRAEKQKQKKKKERKQGRKQGRQTRGEGAQPFRTLPTVAVEELRMLTDRLDRLAAAGVLPEDERQALVDGVAAAVEVMHGLEAALALSATLTADGDFARHAPAALRRLLQLRPRKL
eukprot:SAG22_NODE_49_length_24620_cov_80.053587_11_plen_403_part_00